jgi:UDP-N-acetylmuramoylalanine--D-glutamate ligase
MTFDDEWSGRRATVLGIGVAGRSAARALLARGVDVRVVDSGAGEQRERAADELRALGATVDLGVGDDVGAPADLVVVSPGLPPAAPLVRAARATGAPVWGELQLAWRLRGAGAAPWLCVTGTNGKTTTTLMLEAMLRASGARTVAVGNIGTPIIDAVVRDDLDVLAVEVSATQMPFVRGLHPFAAACLNLAPDHVDFFGGGEEGLAEYRWQKARVYEGTTSVAVYNADSPVTREMLEDSDVVEGCRAVGFTLGAPGPAMLGVVDGLLVDRAFGPTGSAEAVELAIVEDVRSAAPPYIANALAAAALARAYGVEPEAVRGGLGDFVPAAHRIARVATVQDVVYVDDSKATNTHAAQTCLRAFEHAVWIAGGQAKGQSFDDLVAAERHRLRGVILIGVDRGLIADALARHAPEVPVVDLGRTDTGVMDDVVSAAARLARPGDAVLLAPGCASWDMFRDYGHRGDEFAAAVRRLAERAA